MALNDWNNKIADLINNGLSDEEISGYFDAKDAIQFIRDYCARYRRLESDGTSEVPVDVWTEHTLWTREQWRREVASQDTQLGYWGWVAHKDEGGGEPGRSDGHPTN